MAIYGVGMEQAVSMAALGDNELTTGYERDEFLYSCSAIILVNPAVGSAGLYHFPAGDIYRDMGSRVLIEELIADVKPTEALVYFGTQQNMGYSTERSTEPTDREQTDSLKTWLRGQLGFAIQESPATQGSASISFIEGKANYKHGTGTGVTDLKRYASGVYDEGFKVYWRPERPNLHPVLRRTGSAHF